MAKPVSYPRRATIPQMARRVVPDYFLGVAGTGFGSMNGFFTNSTRAAPLEEEVTRLSLMGTSLPLIYLYHSEDHAANMPIARKEPELIAPRGARR